jgi:hypothetical protein
LPQFRSKALREHQNKGKNTDAIRTSPGGAIYFQTGNDATRTPPSEPQVTLLELAQICDSIYYPYEQYDAHLPEGWKPYSNGSGQRDEDRLGYKGQAFISTRTKEIAIVHRGTANLNNVILSDAPLALRLVHEGEAAAIQYVKDVIGFIKGDPDFGGDLETHALPPITVTGHSLGGNEAQAVAAIFQNNPDLPHMPVVTFQAPGVASAYRAPGKMSADYDGLNLVNKGDLVQMAGAVNIGPQSWLAIEPCDALTAHSIVATIVALRQQPAIGEMTQKQYRALMSDTVNNPLEKLSAIGPFEYGVLPYHRNLLPEASSSEIDAILRRAAGLRLLDKPEVSDRQNHRDSLVIVSAEAARKVFSPLLGESVLSELAELSARREKLLDLSADLQNWLEEDQQLKTELEFHAAPASSSQQGPRIIRDIALLDQQIAHFKIARAEGLQEAMMDARLAEYRQARVISLMEKRIDALTKQVHKRPDDQYISSQFNEFKSLLRRMRESPAIVRDQINALYKTTNDEERNKEEQPPALQMQRDSLGELDPRQEALDFFEKVWRQLPSWGSGVKAIIELRHEMTSGWNHLEALISSIDRHAARVMDRYREGLSELTAAKAEGSLGPSDLVPVLEKRLVEMVGRLETLNALRLDRSKALLDEMQAHYKRAGDMVAQSVEELNDIVQQLKKQFPVSFSILDILEKEAPISDAIKVLSEEQQQYARDIIKHRKVHEARELEVHLMKQDIALPGQAQSIEPATSAPAMMNVGEKDMPMETKFVALYVGRNPDHNTFEFELDDKTKVEMTLQQTGAQPLTRNTRYDIVLNSEAPQKKAAITKAVDERERKSDRSSIENKASAKLRRS